MNRSPSSVQQDSNGGSNWAFDLHPTCVAVPQIPEQSWPNSTNSRSLISVRDPELNPGAQDLNGNGNTRILVLLEVQSNGCGSAKQFAIVTSSGGASTEGSDTRGRHSQGRHTKSSHKHQVSADKLSRVGRVAPKEMNFLGTRLHLRHTFPLSGHTSPCASSRVKAMIFDTLRSAHWDASVSERYSQFLEVCCSGANQGGLVRDDKTSINQTIKERRGRLISLLKGKKLWSSGGLRQIIHILFQSQRPHRSCVNRVQDVKETSPCKGEAVRASCQNAASGRNATTRNPSVHQQSEVAMYIEGKTQHFQREAQLFCQKCQTVQVDMVKELGEIPVDREICLIVFQGKLVKQSACKACSQGVATSDAVVPETSF